MKELLNNSWRNKSLVLMALPGFILILMFNYIPMFGLVVAFKKFNFVDGVFGSPWVGLDNFKFLFTSADITWRIIRNTIGYYIIFTIMGTIANVALAIALHECTKKMYAKVTQTMMILPTFISWIAVTFIVKALLDGQNGMINHILLSMGKDAISWYTDPKYWPIILTITNLWKSAGYGSIIYLSALSGMDPELFEAAGLDGATKWQQIRHITLPMLTSMVSIMTLMGLGGIMSSNTGLFYQVTKNVGALYPTTQTIDAYVMNALMIGSSNYGMTSSVTLFQSLVGCIMVLGVNMIVRKMEPENALF